MSGTADPHEPPALPALLGRESRTPSVSFSNGPARIYDDSAADPSYEPPRIRGFSPVNPYLPAGYAERLAQLEAEPDLWDGDQA